MKAASYIGYFCWRSPVLFMTQVPDIFEAQSFSKSLSRQKKKKKEKKIPNINVETNFWKSFAVHISLG